MIYMLCEIFNYFQTIRLWRMSAETPGEIRNWSTMGTNTIKQIKFLVTEAFPGCVHVVRIVTRWHTRKN